MTLKKFKIGDVCLTTDYVANGSFASLKKNVKYLDGDGYAVLVRLTDFTKNWKNSFRYVSKHAYEFLKHSKIYPGDLIISNVGEPGKTFLVPDLGKPATLGPNSVLIRPDNSILSTEYLKYFIDSNFGQKLINSIVTGTTQKKFNKTSLRNLEITIPTIEEQQHIVAKLDAAFAEIDKIIKLNELKDAETDRLKTAFISSVLSDNNWKNIKLGNVIDIVMGQAPPGKKCNKNGEGIPFVKAGEFGEISPVIREWTIEPKKYGKKSDIFLCVVGATCGKINYGTDCAIGRSVAALRPDCKKINQKFLYYFMSQKVHQLRKGSLGSAQTVISKDMINNLHVTLPSLNEQEDIVIKLEKGVEEIDALKNSITKNKINYINLKSTILNKEL